VAVTWWGYVDLNHGPLPYQESSRASDVLQLGPELPLPSVTVHRRPWAVAGIVTQLVTRQWSYALREGFGLSSPVHTVAHLLLVRLPMP
jgi:hypothetical protein